jgi:hypothetical protein
MDLLSIIRGIEFEWKRCSPLCHPDRSVAQWRDLQFNGPVLEMFFADAGSRRFHMNQEGKYGTRI